MGSKEVGQRLLYNSSTQKPPANNHGSLIISRSLDPFGSTTGIVDHVEQIAPEFGSQSGVRPSSEHQRIGLQRVRHKLMKQDRAGRGSKHHVLSARNYWLSLTRPEQRSEVSCDSIDRRFIEASEQCPPSGPR